MEYSATDCPPGEGLDDEWPASPDDPANTEYEVISKQASERSERFRRLGGVVVPGL